MHRQGADPAQGRHHHAVVPEQQRYSPLDVPGIRTSVTARDIVRAVRDSRRRSSSWAKTRLV
jgi:hypothetical protein